MSAPPRLITQAPTIHPPARSYTLTFAPLSNKLSHLMGDVLCPHSLVRGPSRTDTQLNGRYNG
jgi:hypothetical protein